MKRLHLGYDTDTESPCEYDGWKLYSFKRGYDDPYQFFKHDGTPQTGFANKLRVGTAFLLSCFEHGSIHFYLQGEGSPGGWYGLFDYADLAGALVWEQPVKNLGPKKYADREKDARAFLEKYNDWANGQCYWFSLEDEEGEIIDSCGGYIGNDAIKETLKELLLEDELVYVVGDAADLAPYLNVRVA